MGGVLAEEMVEQIEEVKDFFNINVRYYVSVCLEHSLENSGVCCYGSANNTRGNLHIPST